ncbi:MAG TPA: hypothetical protein VIA18_09785 [Polyangia bacterium]|jgi:hypothetical protein|nr:hypothetical protein [Polyangia bacterium]HWE30804.1 hypothetical protein [Polyangia bacterium]
MTSRYAFCLFVSLAAVTACGLSGCSREDGLPDPPLQMLVPCDPTPGSPIACPDLAVIVDGGATD